MNAYQKHRSRLCIKTIRHEKAIAMTDGFRDTSYFDIMYELVPRNETKLVETYIVQNILILKIFIYIGPEKTSGNVCIILTNYSYLDKIFQMKRN